MKLFVIRLRHLFCHNVIDKRITASVTILPFQALFREAFLSTTRNITNHY